MAETLEFTPVYDDATTKFLESEFAKLEGKRTERHVLQNFACPYYICISIIYI